ncbi:MAG: hypothetical protein WC878_00335 [Candidatus Paceibacterota bacterium]|jgi:hypothetical protein
MPPSNNSFEKLEGNDFAKKEQELFAGAEHNRSEAIVMGLVTRRVMETAG